MTVFIFNNSASFSRGTSFLNSFQSFLLINGWDGLAVMTQDCGSCNPGSIPGPGPSRKRILKKKTVLSNAGKGRNSRVSALISIGGDAESYKFLGGTFSLNQLIYTGQLNVSNS